VRQHPSTKDSVLGHKARRIEDYEELDQQYLPDEVACLRAERTRYEMIQFLVLHHNTICIR
jgi:hypothetical protein